MAMKLGGMVAAIMLGAATTGAAPGWRPDTPDRVAIRAQIEALSTEYYYRVDHDDAEGVVELFTPDAVMEIAGQRLVGRDAIRDYYAKRSKSWVTRHITTNLRITYVDADHVEVVRTFTHYQGDRADGPGPYPANPSVAEYRERVERGTDGVWRYAHRASTALFSRR